jgi:hypothetical protein
MQRLDIKTPYIEWVRKNQRPGKLEIATVATGVYSW